MAAQLRANPAAPALFQPQYRLSESYLIPAGQSVERELHGGNGATKRRRNDPGVLLVPLRGRGDRLAGAIYVEPPDTADALELPNIQILEAIARQSALALENALRAARACCRRSSCWPSLAAMSAIRSISTQFSPARSSGSKSPSGGSIALLNDQNELVIVASVGQIDEARAGAAEDRRGHLRLGGRAWYPISFE